jgi:hypothetical protein
MVQDLKETLDGLIAKKEEIQKAFNKQIEQLIEQNGYLKRIEVPKKYIQLWEYHNIRVKIPINWRYVVSIPFIYGMFFPAIIFHIGIEIYQQACFRLNGIPLLNFLG